MSMIRFLSFEERVDAALRSTAAFCCPRVADGAWPSNETRCSFLISSGVDPLFCASIDEFRVHAITDLYDNILLPVSIAAYVAMVPQLAAVIATYWLVLRLLPLKQPEQDDEGV